MTVAASPLDRVAPVIVRDDFLSPDQHSELLDWTLSQQAAFRASQIGSAGVQKDFRSSQRLPDNVIQPWKTWFAPRVTVLLPELIAGLALTPFAAARCELELASHNDGDFQRCHVDTAVGVPSLARTRSISAVYYFYREPQGFTGGALRLHAFRQRGDDQKFRDVTPAQNRLVVFPSWAPHEVMPVICASRAFVDSRFSVNCWIHRTQ